MSQALLIALIGLLAALIGLLASLVMKTKNTVIEIHAMINGQRTEMNLELTVLRQELAEFKRVALAEKSGGNE